MTAINFVKFHLLRPKWLTNEMIQKIENIYRTVRWDGIDNISASEKDLLNKYEKWCKEKHIPFIEPFELISNF